MDWCHEGRECGQGDSHGGRNDGIGVLFIMVDTSNGMGIKKKIMFLKSYLPKNQTPNPPLRSNF